MPCGTRYSISDVSVTAQKALRLGAATSMIALFTPAQVRQMDERSIRGGISSLQLMERAARHLARTVLTCAGAAYGLRVALICGRGNNGGDGVAAARYLRSAGAWPVVCLTCDPAELSADSAAQLEQWRSVGGRVTEDADAALGAADVVVDCLLGTGTSGAPRAPYDAVIDAINATPVPVVACDLPSGVNADTGEVAAGAVRATVTLTLGARKRGLALWPARAYTGEVVVGDIGICRDDDPPVARQVEPSDISSLLPEPSDDGDKRQRGVVAIVAGSSDMSGAATLCARGALGAGAGLVTVATTALARRFVAPNVPEAMTVELPDADPDTAFECIAAACARAGALAIGPGLGHEPPQIELVQRCVAELDLPLVVDADGLNAFRHNATKLARHTTDTLVVTPHRAELARILGAEADEHTMWSRRAELLPELAREWRATVVAKGPGTLIAAPDGRTWIDAQGTVALATGGTGDVLTGMTVATLATGTNPARVAATVALHGLAGRMAAGGSPGSVTSLEVARAIPRVRQQLVGRS